MKRGAGARETDACWVRTHVPGVTRDTRARGKPSYVISRREMGEEDTSEMGPYAQLQRITLRVIFGCGGLGEAGNPERKPAHSRLDRTLAKKQGVAFNTDVGNRHSKGHPGREAGSQSTGSRVRPPGCRVGIADPQGKGLEMVEVLNKHQRRLISDEMIRKAMDRALKVEQKKPRSPAPPERVITTEGRHYTVTKLSSKG